jgi:hypothetical protein
MARYFDPKTWNFNTEPPGVRLPGLAVAALAPVLGALFVMFLPVLGFWMVGKWLLVQSARGAAHAMTFVRRTT